MSEKETSNYQSPDDYQHGYLNGLGGQDKEAYEGYLSSKTSYEWLVEQIDHKKQSFVDFLQRKESIVANRKTVFDALQDEIRGLSESTQKAKDIDAALQEVDDEITLLKERRAASHAKYSLVAGLIFLVAGIAFVMGDLIISHEIVAYALNIRNSNEAWAFAIGLAMVSVLLKPAYDRLIEEPYIDNSRPEYRARYRTFKIGLSIFAVLTLGVLGWFRYEAYRTDKLKEAINKSVRNLQLNAVDPMTGLPIDSPDLTRKIEQALQTSDELNLALVNSPWALLSFVASGVLFAIAGAVTLGLALPVLQHFWFRWFQIDTRLWRLRRRRKKVQKQREAIYALLAGQVKMKNIHENDLLLFPTLEELKKEEYSIKNEIASLEEAKRLALTDSRISSYTDGYDRGEMMKELMSQEELEEWRRSQITVQDLALKAKHTVLDRPAVARGKNLPLRPYQAIRKAITDQLDDSNTN